MTRVLTTVIGRWSLVTGTSPPCDLVAYSVNKPGTGTG